MLVYQRVPLIKFQLSEKTQGCYISINIYTSSCTLVIITLFEMMCKRIIRVHHTTLISCQNKDTANVPIGSVQHAFRTVKAPEKKSRQKSLKPLQQHAQPSHVHVQTSQSTWTLRAQVRRTANGISVVQTLDSQRSKKNGSGTGKRRGPEKSGDKEPLHDAIAVTHASHIVTWHRKICDSVMPDQVRPGQPCRNMQKSHTIQYYTIILQENYGNFVL